MKQYGNIDRFTASSINKPKMQFSSTVRESGPLPDTTLPIDKVKINKTIKSGKY